MSTLPRYQQDIVDNPIQRAERTHLLRSRMSRFWRGLYAVTIFTFIAPILWGFSIHFHQTLEISLGILLILNFAVIFAVEMGIMNQAADSIRREIQDKTWDLLLLTGVDTWRLVLGKWIGVLRGNRRDIVFMYALRVITFFWGMVRTFLLEDGFSLYRYVRTDYVPANILDVRLDVPVLPVVVIIMAVFLALEVMLVAAMPLALSLFRQTRKGAAWLALGLRVFIPIALGMFVMWLAGELEPTMGTIEYRYWNNDVVHLRYSNEVHMGLSSLSTVLGDNGYAWSALHFGTTSYSIGNWSVFFVLGQFVGIGLYALWIWIMLRIAKFAAYRQNVSQPGFVPKGKPKRIIKAEYTLAIQQVAPVITQSQKRDPRDSNLLGVKNPALYRCEVTRYDRDNSLLEIAVYRMAGTSPDFVVRFAGVSFFTGAMNWTNAKFEVLGDNYLQQIADKEKLNYNKLPLGSKLYIVQSQGNRVRIIATDMQIETLATMVV